MSDYVAMMGDTIGRSTVFGLPLQQTWDYTNTGDFAPTYYLQTDAPLADLGPLAWVFEELRKSLDNANKAIKRYVRETEQSRSSDLEAVDPGSLRMARQQLHQAVGALEMVDLAPPAKVLRAMESAVQRLAQRPHHTGTEVHHVAGFLPHDEVDIALAHACLRIGEPRVLLRQGMQALARDLEV